MQVPKPVHISVAVRDFNRLFEKEERGLHALADEALTVLRSGPRSMVLEQFSWKVKSWGRVQGVRNGHEKVAGNALWIMRQKIIRLAEDSGVAQENVVEVVGDLVEAMKPETRRLEWSWASKMLHWLAPDKVPVYDRNVRTALKIRAYREPAYRAIVQREAEWVTCLTPFQAQIVGAVPPATLLRAIDKYLWREGRPTGAQS